LIYASAAVNWLGIKVNQFTAARSWHSDPGLRQAVPLCANQDMIFSFLIIGHLFFALVPGDSRIVSGRIFASTNQEYYSTANVNVIISVGKKMIDTVRTNEEGKFFVSIPSEIGSEIDIYYYGVGFQQLYLGYIKNLSSDTTFFEVDVANKYKRNLFSKAFCPKCGKADKVFRVRYRDAPVYSIRVNRNGDTVHSAIRNGVYQAGTCVSSAQSAQWYCERDRITF